MAEIDAERARGFGRRQTWVLGLLLIAGMAARLAVAAPRLSAPPEDPDNYLPLARALAGGEGFAFNGRPTAYRPPLYPIVLAPLTAWLGAGARLTWAVAVLHLALGSATILFTALAARRLGLGSPRALAAAGIVAFDPVLVVQSRAVMTETMAAALLAPALWAISKNSLRGTVASGCAFGLLVLCRPSMLAALFTCLAAAFLCKPGSLRTRSLRGIALVIPVLAVLAPWALRNARAVGAPVWATTHGGYTLYLANNPVYYKDVLNGPAGAVWTGADQAAWFKRVNRDAANLPEPVADRLFAREAVRFIAANPADFARASLERLKRFWAVAPAEAVYPAPLRIATALWTVPFWLAVLLGATRPNARRWPLSAATAAVVGLTLVHAVFWTDLRMRAPIVPALALLASNAQLSAAAWRRRLRLAGGRGPASGPVGGASGSG